MSSKIVSVEIRNSFGLERIYPANDTANLFTRLTGQKTLSRDNIDVIKKLGFVVAVVTKSVEV